MKVAIVCRDLAGLGGTTRTVVEHSRAFTAEGWDVDVYAWRADRQRLEDAGARVKTIPGLPWGSWPKRRLFAAAADYLTSRGYDAVHGHGDNLRQDALSLHNCVHAASEAVHGKPLDPGDAVGRLHAIQLRERRFKTLICNSKLMAEDAQRRFGVPKEACKVSYPAHDPGQFNTEARERLRWEARAELGFAEDDVVIGLITSGDFAKRGVGLFIEALKSVKGAKAIIVGKEGRLGPFKQAASGLPVRFPEPRPDVERYYHAIDIYCHPALWEEFGQSVQEALACGLPVVCGRNVGAAELFVREMRDFLVDPKKPELAARLSELVRSPDLRRRLSELGPSAVAGNTWSANASATANVLVKS